MMNATCWNFNIMLRRRYIWEVNKHSISKKKHTLASHVPKLRKKKEIKEDEVRVGKWSRYTPDPKDQVLHNIEQGMMYGRSASAYDQRLPFAFSIARDVKFWIDKQETHLPTTRKKSDVHNLLALEHLVKLSIAVNYGTPAWREVIKSVQDSLARIRSIRNSFQLYTYHKEIFEDTNKELKTKKEELIAEIEREMREITKPVDTAKIRELNEKKTAIEEKMSFVEENLKPFEDEEEETKKVSKFWFSNRKEYVEELEHTRLSIREHDHFTEDDEWLSDDD